MVHINDRLLQVKQAAHEVSGSSGLCYYVIDPSPYFQHHITINEMHWVHFSFFPSLSGQVRSGQVSV